MKEREEKLIGPKAKDDETMNFVSRQAQEAILNPSLPESYKDEIVGAAVSTLVRIAERKNAYDAKRRETDRLRRSHIIYDAADHDKKERVRTPLIIHELNDNLQKTAPENKEEFRVEAIAEKAGINRKMLYGWVKNDSEFSEALERLKDVQKNDPFKTGTEEDTYVNAMMIALLLLETKDRHYKPDNT